jgi:hypothetical protein
MRKKDVVQESPEQAIMNALNYNEGHLFRQHANKYGTILAKTKMQLRSAHSEAAYMPPVVFEGTEFFKIYTCLNFNKPLYRKIELLAQLHDEGFQTYLMYLIEDHVNAVLDNLDELALCIRKRIEEEAYDLGTKHPNAREGKLAEAKKRE